MQSVFSDEDAALNKPTVVDEMFIARVSMCAFVCVCECIHAHACVCFQSTCCL